jgi:hypothetical protein
MTKEQFISGTPFYLTKKCYKGDSTYSYGEGSISRQVRSSIDDRVILDSYECNVTKVGRVGFSGFTYVLGKKVLIKGRFVDLVEFKQEEA